MLLFPVVMVTHSVRRYLSDVVDSVFGDGKWQRWDRGGARLLYHEICHLLYTTAAVRGSDLRYRSSALGRRVRVDVSCCIHATH